MRRTRNQRRAFGRFINKHFKSATQIIRAADGHTIIGSWLARLLLRKSLCRTESRMLPLKHLRLQELAHADFNCADFKFWLRNIRFAQYVGAVSIESYSAFSQLREDIFLEIRLLRAYSRHQETPLDFR